MQIDVGTTTSAQTIFSYVSGIFTSFEGVITLLFGMLLAFSLIKVFVDLFRYFGVKEEKVLYGDFYNPDDDPEIEEERRRYYGDQ
jgi:hypothetical protein